MKKIFLIASISLAACDEQVDIPEVGNIFGELTVSGNYEVGQTLSTTIVDENGLENTSISYKWSTEEDIITSETGASLTLTDSLIGKEISVTVSYTDNAGFNEVIKSVPSTPITAPLTNSVGTIAITGSPKVNFLLAAEVIDGNGADNNISYTWMADNIEIAGATNRTFTPTTAQIGSLLTVSATYIDNDNFNESITSASTEAITDPVLSGNVTGQITLNKEGLIFSSDLIIATITDPNGVSNPDLQWQADGVDIIGETDLSYTVSADDLGKTLTLKAIYTDDDGFSENISVTTNERVYSVVVYNENELASAIAAASEGDWIALATASGGDYDAMLELDVNVKSITLTKTAHSTATFTGKTCIELSKDNIVIDGLDFDQVDYITSSQCDSSGNSVLLINADNIVVKNSSFTNDTGTSKEFNMMAIKGNNNTIERNLFSGNNTGREKSGAISFFSDESAGDKENNVVQYNLFKNMSTENDDASLRHSGAYAIQVGRSTGTDSVGDSFHRVQYNRFDNVQVDERLIKLQTTNAIVKGNSIVNSTGMITLEDGSQNTVENNIIISQGDDADDGGIAFAPMGHTITNNYIENIRTTSGDRAALFMHTDMVKNAGNQAIISSGIDLTVTINNNTITNAQQGFQFDDKDCAHVNSIAAKLDFDDNLIANESALPAHYTSTTINGNKSAAIIDDDFVSSSCTGVDASTDWDNNHFYAKELSKTAAWDFNGKSADNTSGGRDGAVWTRDTNNLLSGATGADLTKLKLITEELVGPDSTWTIND